MKKSKKGIKKLRILIYMPSLSILCAGIFFIVRTEFMDYPEFTQPSDKMPKQPEWVKKFKTSKNNVTISTTEVGW
ncbi:MAG TPA: hypothetical protein PK304_04195 [Mobilitalea sp.]|nr:hypothetical protein [Mobilitalea sp.]